MEKDNTQEKPKGFVENWYQYFVGPGDDGEGILFTSAYFETLTDDEKRFVYDKAENHLRYNIYY